MLMRVCAHTHTLTLKHIHTQSGALSSWIRAQIHHLHIFTSSHLHAYGTLIPLPIICVVPAECARQ